MSYYWNITENYRGTILEQQFSSLDKALSAKGELASRGPIGRVTKTKVADRFYFIKRYGRGGSRLRRYIGKSRLRSEWENLLFFSHLDIPTAEIVAYGQKYRWGLFYRGALITEELKDTIDLAALAKNKSPLLKNRDWVRQVIQQVADFTKRLHDKGFIHYDLKWRNILVNNERKPQVFFIDCPVGKKCFGPMLRRGIIKDLACLDKIAKYQMSRTDRLRFYKAYSGHNRLTRRDKRLIKKVLVFFSGRE